MDQASVDGKPRRRQSGETARDDDDADDDCTSDDSRCDCCSVLTHQKTHIQTAANL